MGFRLIPKWVTLNDLERRNDRCIALFHWLWQTCVPTQRRRSVAKFIYKSIVFCSVCTMSSVRKFTSAISSPDEFLGIKVCWKQMNRWLIIFTYSRINLYLGNLMTYDEVFAM